MIIIGHPWVESQVFRKTSSLAEIKASTSSEILLFDSLLTSQDLVQYCYKNTIAYAVEVASLKEAVFANALEAKYLLCSKAQAKEIQEMAQEYLFDTRVLVKITNEDEIDAIAKLGIDGVIFKEAIR